MIQPKKKVMRIDDINEEAAEMIRQNEQQISDRDLALFLRWLLKHYETKTTQDGFFCYVDSMGKEINIETIIHQYKAEQ
jgi:hypothetical protein